MVSFFLSDLTWNAPICIIAIVCKGFWYCNVLRFGCTKLKNKSIYLSICNQLYNSWTFLGLRVLGQFSAEYVRVLTVLTLRSGHCPTVRIDTCSYSRMRSKRTEPTCNLCRYVTNHFVLQYCNIPYNRPIYFSKAMYVTGFAPKLSTWARAVANNESSKVVGIIKPGRRFKLGGHM